MRQKIPLRLLLYGLNKSGKVEDVVLIADNWAKARDIKMLASVKVPVRVILCGVYRRYGNKRRLFEYCV
jgi:hypothetical protein